MLTLQPIGANKDNSVMPYIYLNTFMILAKYFDKRENILNHPKNDFHVGYSLKYFFYNILEMVYPRFMEFYTLHGASPFCRKTFRELWERETEYLTDISNDMFRGKIDISRDLFREWQKFTGNLHSKNVHRNFSYFSIKENNDKLLKAIWSRKNL